MDIRSFCNVPVEVDEPVPAIRQFVRLLRTCAQTTPKSTVTINLLGTSARARSVIQELEPDRAAAVPFEEALTIVEGLADLPPAKIRSLHVQLTAEEFRWKGSGAAASGKLLLLDMKVFQRKQRFALTATMDCSTTSPTSPTTEAAELFATVKVETGLTFTLGHSAVNFGTDDRQQATAEQLLVAQLTWHELIDAMGRTLRPMFDVATLPNLMSADETIAFNFDQRNIGKAQRVDFTGIVRRWLKQHFTSYELGKDGDRFSIGKPIAPDLAVALYFDKQSGAFSKNFSAAVGLELSAPEFATMPERPTGLFVDLFEPFERFMYKWAYFTEQELRTALDGSKPLIEAVLTFLQQEAPTRFQNVLQRSLNDFEGPREITAREACEQASASVKAWAADAALNTVQLFPVGLFGRGPLGSPVGSPVGSPLRSNSGTDGFPSFSAQGRLGLAGQWRLIFHSAQRQQKLQIVVPCRGPLRRAYFPYSSGERMGLTPPQTLPDDWTDSSTVLERALAELSLDKPPDATRAALAPAQFELRSDHVFGQAWHLTFHVKDTNGSVTITHVTLPARGDAKAQVSTIAAPMPRRSPP